MITIPTKRKSTSSNGRAPKRPPRQQRKDYEETPDWGTAFQRADNQPPRPGFTGQGVISQETLDEIAEHGGECQISIWTLDSDGKPLRNRDGTRRFRVHIEAPYDAEDGDQEGDDADESDDEDIPF